MNAQKLGAVAPSTKIDASGVSVAAKSLTANDVSGAVTAKSAVANGVSGSHTNGVATVGVGDIDVQGFGAGGMSVDRLGLKGGTMRNDGTGTTVGAKSASGAGISGHGVNVKGAQVTDAALAVPTTGGVGFNAGGHGGPAPGRRNVDRGLRQAGLA